MSWYEVQTERVEWEHDYAMPAYSADPRVVQVYVVYENQSETFEKGETFENEEIVYEEVYPSTSSFNQEVALELDVCDYEEEAGASDYRWYNDNEHYEETVKVDEDFALDSPPILEPQVSRTARNTEICRLCSQSVPTGCRRMHIRRFHLQQKLFRCPHCPFSSTYSYGNVRAHMWQVHYSKLKPITLKKSQNDVMMDYAYMCFGDQRLLAKYEKEAVDTVMDLIDWAADGVRPEDLMPVSQQQQRQRANESIAWEEMGDDGLPFDIIDPGEEEAQEPGTTNEKRSVVSEPRQILEPCPQLRIDEPATKRSKRPTSTCLLCGLRGITHRERHVLQHHFKRLVYLCPHCSFGSTYAANVIKDHMRTKHVALGGAPIDIRNKALEKINEIYEKCFGPISYVDA